ncbi:hypothetical protein BH11BAC7_BH11BAC7_21800 [soil metagenome]
MTKTEILTPYLKTKPVSYFFDADTYKKAEELAAFIVTETPFTVKDANVASHNIHYWIKQGLFPNKGDAAVIRMNFIEFVWLKILSEIRMAGLKAETLEGLFDELVKPLDNYVLYEKLAADPSFIDSLQLPDSEKRKIKALLKSGTWKETAKSETQFSPLLLLIAEAISKRTFVNVAVFLFGGYAPLVDDTLHLLPASTIQRLKTETHLVISITNILKGFLGDERFSSIVPNLNYFNAEEIKLLELVRSKKYDSIKIRFSEKRMDFIELEKHADVHKKIVDILSENAFQSISIAQQNGKISRIIHTVKMKV